MCLMGVKMGTAVTSTAVESVETDSVVRPKDWVFLLALKFSV